MGELPKCPLCGSGPKREGPTMICGGKNGYCAIEPENEHAGPVFTVDEWMRLAAAPLPPEAVAVLEACETWHETISGDGTADGDLDDAILDWISEGRPGLPPRAGAGREEK